VVYNKQKKREGPSLDLESGRQDALPCIISRPNRFSVI